MTDGDDLSARARRRELDDEDLRRLRRTLDGSLEARLAHRAGVDFDAGDVVRPGDDELARRIVERVVASRTKTRRFRWRRAWWIAAAALSAGTALAAVAPLTRMVRSLMGAHVSEEHHDPSSPPPPRTIATTPKDDALPAASAVTAEAIREPQTTADERTPRARDGAGPSSRAAPSPSSASALFADANLSRREGHSARAMEQYEELQRRYPEAAESRAADVLLGTLLLDAGSASRALRYFDHHLRAPSAELVPEALWGKSQALARLGRVEDARKVWELISNRYPDCAYAKAARAKLSAR